MPAGIHNQIGRLVINHTISRCHVMVVILVVSPGTPRRVMACYRHDEMPGGGQRGLWFILPETLVLAGLRFRRPLSPAVSFSTRVSAGMKPLLGRDSSTNIRGSPAQVSKGWTSLLVEIQQELGHDRLLCQRTAKQCHNNDGIIASVIERAVCCVICPAPHPKS